MSFSVLLLSIYLFHCKMIFFWVDGILLDHLKKFTLPISLIIGVFRLLAFRVIIDMLGLKCAILLFLFVLFLIPLFIVSYLPVAYLDIVLGFHLDL